MKSLLLFFTLFFGLPALAQNVNNYAIFSEKPQKRIGYTNLGHNNYFIEYQSKKRATIFLELISNDSTVIAISKKTVKSKESSIAKLNLNAYPAIKAKPGSGYFLRLRMYESDIIDVSKLITEVIVDDVSLTRLLY